MISNGTIIYLFKHAELPFEITETNMPKWLEKPLQTALVLFTGVNGS